MLFTFVPLVEIADSATPTYGWESVGLALLLALGLIGGLALTQALHRWLVRQMTRSGSKPGETNGPQEC